jgi:hypothetical protein
MSMDHANCTGPRDSSDKPDQSDNSAPQSGLNLGLALAPPHWPPVPACYDWLSLDRRGDWRLQGERITHAGLIAFINQQYGSDSSGCWLMQNGPQRVFVTLAYTPWVLRLLPDRVQTHTGRQLIPTHGYLDREGNALIASENTIGLLDDRDLASFLDACRQADTQPVNDENWLKLMAGEAVEAITWRGLPITSIDQSEVAHRFNFQPHPRP